MTNFIRPKAGRHSMNWGRAVAMAGLLFCCLSGLWMGCSQQQRYRTLSFFFDGVPDPNAPPVDPDREYQEDYGPKGKVTKVVVYAHKPFAENKCNSCHLGASGQYEDFTALPSTVCMKCHEKIPTQHRIMHGPVAAIECKLCHNPHESEYRHLLRETPQKVCGQCHVPELLSAKPPAHLDATRSCLDCHVAHGAERHGLLLAGVSLDHLPTTGPSTQPSTQPDTAPSTQPTPASATQPVAAGGQP